MRVLVTGGAGFIGRNVVETATRSGWEVRVLDSLRADVHGPEPVVDDLADGNLIRADVRDRDAVNDALQGVGAVVHLAAKVGLGVDFGDAPDYVASNAFGTATLLAAMTERGIERLVLASSMVVYGEGAYDGPAGRERPAPRRVADLDAGRFDPLGADGSPLVPGLIDEDDLLDPRNVYATTKLTQEHLAASWARATGGAAVALRYHNVYGPGMPANTPYAGVAALFRSAIARGEAPHVFEDGRQRRDFVHVADIASANLAALSATADLTPGTFRPFNVGSGEVHTIGDLATELCRDAGVGAPLITGEYRLGDVRHITASSSRLRRELDWMPSVAFADGIREFATAELRMPA